MIEARDRVRARAGPTPLLLKIAPDLTLADLDDIVGVARSAQGRRHDRRQHHGAAVRRRCASARSRSSRAACPASRCFALSTRMLAETYVRLEGAMPLIGVGGIDSGEAAVAKLRAGATLVQLYSGLVFHGLGAGLRDQARPARSRREKADTLGGPGRRRCRRHHRAAMAGVRSVPTRCNTMLLAERESSWNAGSRFAATTELRRDMKRTAPWAR